MASPRPWLQALIFTAAIGCHRGEPLPPGDVAATLTVHAVGSHSFDPATLHGKPSLVMFVTPTCPHCLKTIPEGDAAAKAEGVPVVAVFVAGKEDNASGVLRKTEFAGTALVDDGTLTKRYDIRRVPYTLVLGADGHARAAFTGEQDAATLRSAIADAR
jgi:thiol-disulfide isomerase/thioredoxin